MSLISAGSILLDSTFNVANGGGIQEFWNYYNSNIEKNSPISSVLFSVKSSETFV